MSIAIHFTDVIKKYGDTTVIPGLSLKIKKGEFFTLLGPSGCGKTTLLRMVAGFNSIEGGEIHFDDKVVNELAPQHRNIGMVFQNYAIFPHMTVKQNVAFGLKNKKLPKDEIEKRVDDILEVVQISQFKDTLPENLSGGQQQRIALARAIVIEPDVLLMDEPLSNLDAKLRVEMREAIKSIQRKVGITTIYVTHDQEEAMAVSDRIAVMKSGEIQQVGTPKEIYQRPENIFVASFIGRTNVLERQINRREDGSYRLHMDPSYHVSIKDIVWSKETNQETMMAKLSVRPEEFIIDDDESGMEGTILTSSFLGMNTHYLVELGDGEHVEIIQESILGDYLPAGTLVKLRIKKEKINVFDHNTERTMLGGRSK
ncbi:ABC transporter ATP-binding protein [Lentibacillus saliphilus]|uniref:ABC transporter ATP-binding protein n=1 Tax=Lentibacillus saliphilus TaxID=2737028 RepID=UPI001C2F99C8